MNPVIEWFKSKGIPVFKRGEEQYERSVATPNLLYRFARPEFVLLPETPEQVETIVQKVRAETIDQEVRTKNLVLTIKCGGHSYAGHSTAFEGVSLDLRRMNHAEFDMVSNTITFGGGCQWGHLYKTLVNGRHDGYMVNGGRCPFVGVGGFLLGGGLGPFSRSIGMGSDTIKEIKIVTADGELRTVKETDSRDSKEGRLFWALRGAGGGNFGVVVEMKIAVKKLQARDGVVVAGRYRWFARRDEPDLFEQDDFMSTMNKFYTTNWPNNITIDSTWVCDLRLNSGNGVRFLTYFDGDKENFDSTIDQYIEHRELAKQLKRRSLEEKSTRFLHETLVAQWSEETVKAFPTNKSYSIYSSFIFPNDPHTIHQITALIRDKAVAFRNAFSGERVEFLATFIHSGGEMSTPSFDHSAIFWREGTYHMYLTVEWEDKWMERDMRAFLDDVKWHLRPLSLWGHAAYINFPDGALPADYSEWAYWGGNRDELRRIKKIWDNDNFFRSQQSVRLPPPPPFTIPVDRSDDEPGQRSDNREELHHTQEIGEKDNFPSEQGVRLPRGIPGDEDNDEREYRAENPEELDDIEEIQDKDDLPQSEQGIRVYSGIPGRVSGDSANDEDLTDSLASKHWEVYETKDIVGGHVGGRALADLGLWSGF